MLKIVVALVALAASTAHAAQERPLLAKSTSAGFAPEAFTASISCQIFTNRVEIMRHNGYVTTKETRPVTHFNFEGVTALIAEAAQAPLKGDQPAPMDAPIRTYSASKDGILDLTLRGVTSDSRIGERDSNAGAALMRMLDGLCGEGYFGF